MGEGRGASGPRSAGGPGPAQDGAVRPLAPRLRSREKGAAEGRLTGRRRSPAPRGAASGSAGLSLEGERSEPDQQKGAQASMPRIPERRRVARLPIPSQLSGPGWEVHQVRLLDLSAQGARIEHSRSLPERDVFFLDLPPALGGPICRGKPSGPKRLNIPRGPRGKEGPSYKAGSALPCFPPGSRNASPRP
jgi:hypothetical protein